MPDSMSAHRLFDQRLIMLARQTIGFGLFTHLCKQPAALELNEQLVHSSNGAIAKGIQFLVQQRAQLLRIQIGS